MTDKPLSSLYTDNFLVDTPDRYSTGLDDWCALRTRALIVEDDPVTRWVMRRVLKTECLISVASNMKSAFSIYASWKPDIVFVDIGLPDGTGHEFLQWVMHNDPGAWVVMLTAYTDYENIERSVNCGARGYIVKPFEKSKVLDYIRDCPKLH